MGHVGQPADHVEPAARWLVVTGMAFEARVLAWPGGTTLSGLRGDAIDRALAAALQDGEGSAGRHAGVLSFGVAGGLDPTLPAGTVIVADAVVAAGRRLDTASRWASAIRAALPDAVGGTIAGVDAPVASVADKVALHAATGAVAVDMESHRIAAAAHAAGLPFVICRAIADPAPRRVPPAALAAFGADGGINLRGLCLSVLAQPFQLGELARLATDAAAARRGLRRLAAALRSAARELAAHGDAGAGVFVPGDSAPVAPSPSSPSSP